MFRPMPTMMVPPTAHISVTMAGSMPWPTAPKIRVMPPSYTRMGRAEKATPTPMAAAKVTAVTPSITDLEMRML